MTEGSDIVAVDTGGTFTDIISWTGHEMRTLKVLSTPRDPSLAVGQGLKTFSPTSPPEQVVHGTTVATNALLERKGAVTALITNQGFEDFLHIGRQARPDLYALHVRRPVPLIPAELCFGIPGRIDAQGEEVTPLDPAEIPQWVETFQHQGVQAVVVSLLHAYANPTHEQAVKQALMEAADSMEFPLDITLSTDVLPEFREVERTATATINAYVRPIMSSYLHHLENQLTSSRLRVMQSNGGSASVEHAANLPVHTILSGPAGGVVGAIHLAKLAGFDRILTFDMGGTSTDVALCDGGIPLSTGTEAGGLPIRIPMIDIHTVGAGGGSIAWRDPGGALRVGPESAGASPGPACYGNGGLRPTVTDANLLRGRLHPDHFLGGDMPLLRQPAEEAIQSLSNAMMGERDETALGICAIANAIMERALKGISVARGHDPAHFTLVTFGGAGGMHACDLATSLRIPTILVPPHPGLLSALGMLVCDVQLDFSKTALLSIPVGKTAAPPEAEKVLHDLLQQAREGLDAEGVSPTFQTLTAFADIRYMGQSFEIQVPFDKDFAGAFHQAHETLYGFSLEDTPMELVTLRVKAVGSTPSPALAPATATACEAIPDGTTPMLFESGWMEGGIYPREKLMPGMHLRGPALIVEYSSTTTVAPGWRGEIDLWGSLILRKEDSP